MTPDNHQVSSISTCRTKEPKVMICTIVGSNLVSPHWKHFPSKRTQHQKWQPQKKIREAIAQTDNPNVTNDFRLSGITEILFRLLYCLTWPDEDGKQFSCVVSRPRQQEQYMAAPSNENQSYSSYHHSNSDRSIFDGNEYCSDPMWAFYANVSWLHNEYYFIPKPPAKH